MPFTVQLPDGTEITGATFEEVVGLVDAHEPEELPEPEPISPPELTPEDQTALPIDSVLNGS